MQPAPWRAAGATLGRFASHRTSDQVRSISIGLEVSVVPKWRRVLQGNSSETRGNDGREGKSSAFKFLMICFPVPSGDVEYFVESHASREGGTSRKKNFNALWPREQRFFNVVSCFHRIRGRFSSRTTEKTPSMRKKTSQGFSSRHIPGGTRTKPRPWRWGTEFPFGNLAGTGG